MASYKDVLKLVRGGKSPAEIREALPMSPYYVKRLLCSPRLVAELELDRHVAERLARHRLAASIDRLIERRLEIVESQDDEQADKTAQKLVETYSAPVGGKAAAKAEEKAAGKEMDIQQKIEFLRQLAAVNVVDFDMPAKNQVTGKYFFEEAIERGRWIDRQYGQHKQPAETDQNQV